MSHWCLIHIKDGKVENPGALKTLFSQLKDGKWKVDINSAQQRSNPQNRYYFGLVVPLVQNGILNLGTELTREETHEFLKARFNSSEVVNKETGEYVQVPRSTTMLSKEKFSEYIEQIQIFAAEFLQVIIPDPGQQMMLEI